MAVLIQGLGPQLVQLEADTGATIPARVIPALASCKKLRRVSLGIVAVMDVLVQLPVLSLVALGFLSFSAVGRSRAHTATQPGKRCISREVPA